jgi:DNA-binding transcriptional LysR family regulator
MNKLAGMQAFAHVVESGGFTGAAKRMGVSVSAVTKHINRLEAELGAQLLVRTTRRTAITEFGRDYYATCRKIFSELEEVENALRQSQKQVRGKLSILCPSYFARVSLLPRLHEFYALYPDVELEITLAERYTDIIASGINMAVVVGDLKDSRLASRLLTRGPRVCCATPDYIARHGMPERIDDVMTHNCLVSRTALWQFREGGKRVEVAVKGNLIVHSGDALREATLLGLGLAQSNWWVFRRDIASGALVECLRKYRAPGLTMSVVFPPTRFVPRKIRAMIDFLVEITSV